MTKRLYDHQHGQINRLCIHPDCQRAWARRNKTWKVDRSRGLYALTDDPQQLQRIAHHIHTLEAAGWSRRSIAAASGLSATAVSRLGNQRQAHVRRTTAAAILALDPAGIPTKAFGDATEPFVPKLGTSRRIQALIAIGWTHTDLTQRSGVKTAVVLSQSGRWVTRTTHDKVAALYRQLATTPGPSQINRTRAARLGYATPIAWHDIDRDPHPDGSDLHHEPQLRHHDQVDDVVVDRILAGDRLPATRAEKEAVVTAWTARGRSLAALERQTGWKTDRYTRSTTTGDAA